jgi:hypothetical protein
MQGADVRMRNPSDGSSLVAEALDPSARRVQEIGREKLEGDGSIQARIARAVHFTHPAGTEQSEDLERAE